jgi:hypothetical protein
MSQEITKFVLAMLVLPWIIETAHAQSTPAGTAVDKTVVTVTCSSQQPAALPCTDDARQKCDGDAKLVAIVTAQQVPVNPMGQGNSAIWRYEARYRCTPK